MGSHGISLAKEANAFLEHDCIPSVSVHAMDNKHEQPFVIEQGRYYPTSAGCYGYYCTDFDPIGSRVDHSNILQLDGPDLYHPAQPAESLHYAYYPPNPAYEQSAYNPFNPYIPGAFVGTGGPFVVSQPYHRGSPYQQPFYSPSYFPVVMQSRIDTSTFSLPDNSLPDVSITTTTSLSAECGPSSSVSTVTISEGTSSQSFNAGRKSQNLAANIQNLQTIDVKSAPVAHKAANNLTIQLPYREFVTSRYRGSDTMSEQNAAPRGDNFIDQQTASVSFKVYSSQAVGNATQEEVSICPDQCNGDGFPVSYPDAKFFVIKSYSEDDIQQSIKYNVWSSTPNGNKRLDAAYQDAQRRSSGNHRACPIFLFFSVNASGRFCGVAEMIGPVDFQNDMNFWQQDKWSGSFPVKWHLIKDVPNPNFWHIRLENNENKPVTNSRDTQEVMYIEGNEMLKIFKSYASKTSILDDFMYYEEGQKALFRKTPKQQNLVDMDCCLLPSVTNNAHTDIEQATSLQVQDPNEVNVTRQVLVDDIENESSIVKIDSLTIEPKEGAGSTTNISNIGSENNDSVDTVTVGSITIKVSGIASAPFSSDDNAAGHDEDASNMLTIGTISFDPKAFEQGRHCAFKVGNRSTCG